VVTALAQVVAEELDVRFDKVYMDSGDTDKAVDQGVTAAARTIERRRATPAGIRRGAARNCSSGLLRGSIRRMDKLTVTDGVVSVVGNPSRKIAYGDLLAASAST